MVNYLLTDAAAIWEQLKFGLFHGKNEVWVISVTDPHCPITEGSPYTGGNRRQRDQKAPVTRMIRPRDRDSVCGQTPAVYWPRCTARKLLAIARLRIAREASVWKRRCCNAWHKQRSYCHARGLLDKWRAVLGQQSIDNEQLSNAIRQNTSSSTADLKTGTGSESAEELPSSIEQSHNDNDVTPIRWNWRDECLH